VLNADTDTPGDDSSDDAVSRPESVPSFAVVAAFDSIPADEVPMAGVVISMSADEDPIAPDVDSRSDVVIGGSDCIDELAVSPSPAE